MDGSRDANQGELSMPHAKRKELRIVALSQGERRSGLAETDCSPVGDAPDVSEPLEAMVWRSEVFGGVQIDVSSFDPRFLELRLRQIRAGVRGRGKAELEDGILTVQFGLTEAEQRDTRLLDDYRDALLSFLGLTSDAVLDQLIAPTDLPPEFESQIDRAVLALGLRAIHG